MTVPAAEITGRLTSYLVSRSQLGQEDAERAVNEALSFMDQAAVSPEPLTPGDLADVAWHAFILHTRDYAEYCQDRYGRYLHHIPTDEKCDAGGVGGGGGGGTCSGPCHNG